MIALCPNPFRDIDLETTKEAAELLGKEGFETVICPVFAEQGDACLPQNIKYERVIEWKKSYNCSSWKQSKRFNKIFRWYE